MTRSGFPWTTHGVEEMTLCCCCFDSFLSVGVRDRCEFTLSSRPESPGEVGKDNGIGDSFTPEESGQRTPVLL